MTFEKLKEQIYKGETIIWKDNRFITAKVLKILWPKFNGDLGYYYYTQHPDNIDKYYGYTKIVVNNNLIHASFFYELYQESKQNIDNIQILEF